MEIEKILTTLLSGIFLISAASYFVVSFFPSTSFVGSSYYTIYIILESIVALIAVVIAIGLFLEILENASKN